MATQPQYDLLGLDIQELTTIVQASGQPGYRARQIFEAIYSQRMTSPSGISSLPAVFRSALAQAYAVGIPEIKARFAAQDGTVRYLIGFPDGETVETVWMP